ncbi:hypothetical protein [Streptomyces alfalfae]
MSQWNLSVRLTGQGSDLSRTLRATSADARAASRDITTLRRDISRLRAEARQPVRLRLGVDARSLRGEVRRAVGTAAGQRVHVGLAVDGTRLRSDVRRALSGAAGQGLAVDLRLGDTMQLRRDVTTAVRWAGMGQRIEIPLVLADRMSLRRDVSAAVRWASMNQTINVRVQADTSGLGDLTRTLGGGGGGIDFGLAGFLPLATAAIPLIAGVAANLAPLAGAFAATGGAATAFGIALGGQIGPLREAAEAEKAYQDAVSEHGRGSMEAAQAQLAYQQRLAKMPPETQKAAVALSSLKTEFKGWSDDMAGFTMAPVTKGFTVLQELLPHLSPEVKSFSGQMDRLMNVAGGAISTPGFDAISDKVADLTDAQLDAFTDQVIHLLRIVSEGDADAGAIGQILAYFRENGPEAREALDAIGDAVSTLAQGAAQAGPTMLALVTAAARLVAALPPELVAIILQVVTALKLLQLAGVGAAAAAVGLTRVRTAITGLAATSAAAGGGLAGLRAAFLALGTAAKASVVVAGIALAALAIEKISSIGEKAAPDVDKLTTSLGNLGRTGKVTGYAAEQFGQDFSKLNDEISKVTNPSVVESINNWGSDITGGFLDAGDATEDFTKTAESADESLANLVRSGNAKQAKAALEAMLKGLSPENAKKFRSELEGYDEALADMKFEADTTADSMGVFGAAVQATSAKLDAQKGSVDGLRASILALNEANRAAHDAETKFEAGLDDLSESFKKNGATLDKHTEAGRANRDAMSAAAKAQDEMIVSGIAVGASFETMVGKSSALRSEMMKLATDAFDGNTSKARTYVNTLLGTPKEVKTIIRAEQKQAITGIEEVLSAIRRTPNAKKVTVSTLNAAAIEALEKVGYKTRTLPDGRTAVYTANGQAIGSIGEVASLLNRLDGKTARTYTTHYTSYVIKGRPGGPPSGRYLGSTAGRSADGNIYGPAKLQRFADGGMRENHVAQIAQPTFRMWAEPETGGEAYIPFAASKRPRSRAIAEETVRRLGGDPAAIQWNADGSVTDWRYDPNTGSLYSPSDAGSAGNKTRKVKGKSVDYFDLGAVERKLKSASKATKAWNSDLEKVADRVGGDVAEALASMGKEGVKLADKMARGSTKYINEMAAAIRGLKKEAKASLTDYNRQMGKANTLNEKFSKDLATLAARGHGDLAKQLAAQNDEAAQQLAAAAVKDNKKAATANRTAKTANNALTSDQVEQLVAIIGAITKSTTGIHDVAAATGLDEDDIIAVATKAAGQIKTSLGGRAGKFLTDLGRAQKGLSYANGGIRSGIYATKNGAVTFAEPQTGGEAFIPLGADKRRHALPVLSDVASRFGLGLKDASEGRVIIVREQGPAIGTLTIPVSQPRATADQIADTVAYQMRRAQRGGARR